MDSAPSQPMLALKESNDKPKVTANLLPCRVQHDGPIDPIESFWTPVQAEAYFRGRKLQGKTVPLPSTYRGVVMERKADELRKEMQSGEGTQDDDDMVPLESVGMMQATEEFDEMIVWSHEALATAAGDPYVRSVEEWLQMADQVIEPPVYI
ncbi:hypothetical protein Golomagni_07559 [Golovinomyces magnicellulatus]|nr:hypothetical protein Golomagni_07559 [Golovinomyces magnicellulatus]